MALIHFEFDKLKCWLAEKQRMSNRGVGRRKFWCWCLSFPWRAVYLFSVLASDGIVRGFYHAEFFADYWVEVTSAGHWQPMLAHSGKVTGHWQSMLDILHLSCFHPLTLNSPKQKSTKPLSISHFEIAIWNSTQTNLQFGFLYWKCDAQSANFIFVRACKKNSDL